MACGCGKNKKNKKVVAKARKKAIRKRSMPLVKIKRTIPKRSVKR